MADDEQQGFSIDGMFWKGTRDEYDYWVEYKRTKAVSLVLQGWSVGWRPDASNWIDVFRPPNSAAGWSGYVAAANFYLKGSKYGIDGGSVSKLMIRRYESSLERLLSGRGTVEVVYNYDRGLDIDKFDHHPEAKELYRAVIRELNTPDRK